MSFIVAIDGTAGTGKGSITKLIAKELGLVNVDTGAIYRCIALEAINRNLTKENEQEIIRMVEEINIEIQNQEGDQTIFLNGKDVTKEIRTEKVTNIVSPISSIIEVRLKVTQMERKFAENQDIIMEGRDIGTYVFPEADVKIYLDATLEERAKRRFLQNQQAGIDIPYETIIEKIQIRDENDKHKVLGALKPAQDALIIDTTNKSIQEVKELVKEAILAKRR